MSAANPQQHLPSGSSPPGLSVGGAASYDKSGLLRDYALAWGCRSCVETGLYEGAGSGMPLLSAGVVERYFALDYQEANAALARSRLPRADVRVGDSAVTLAALLAEGVVTPPCLFWLDAHAVYDHESPPTRCPLPGELGAIVAWEHARSAVVLIDDLWGMGTVPEWPSLEQLRELVDVGLWDRDEDGGIMRLTPHR